VLVAFSGRVVDDDSPEGVAEPSLTGYGERELPEVFARDEYKILIVADKYLLKKVYARLQDKNTL
jgi:type I restriction enzyme R subunit